MTAPMLYPQVVCGILGVLAPCTAAVAPAAAATSPAPAAVTFEDGDDQYNFVAGLFERGLHDVVVREAEKFLGQYPQHSRIRLIRYRLGLSLIELGRFQEARPVLQQLEKQPGQYATEILFRLGQCSFELGDHADAAARYDQVAAQDHELSDEAAYFAGESHFQLGDFGKAAGAYARCLKGDPDADLSRRSLYGLGWSYYRASEFESAAQAFELYLRRHPQDASRGEVLFLHGECLLNQDQAQAAIERFMKVPAGEFADDALCAAGFAYASLEDHESATAMFLRVEREHTTSSRVNEARLHAGIQSYRAKRYRRAAEVLDRLLQADDDEWNGEACYWRGRVEAEASGPDQALRYFERGLQLAGTDELRERLTGARSDALFDAGRFDEAREAYANMSGSESSLFSSAVAALNAGQPAQAVELARALITRFPSGQFLLQGRLTLGEGLFAQEQYQEAIAPFQKVASEATDQELRSRSMSRIAWCHFYLENYEEAAKRFYAVSNQFPADERAAEASFLEGRSWLRAGRHQKAEEVLEGHLQAYGGGDYDDDVLYDLSQAKLQLGKDEEAGRLLEQVGQSGNRDEGLGQRSLFDRAELAAAAGKHEEALELLEEVLASDPEPSLRRPALYAHAWSASELGQLNVASNSLRKLLKSPGSRDLAIPSLELLAAVERKAGRADVAVQVYQALVKTAPKSDRIPEVALTAALAHKESGQPAKAVELLEQVATTFPQSSALDRIRFELAFLYQDLGRADDCRAMLARVEIDHPTSPLAAEAAFYRAEILFDEGQFEPALTAYQSSGEKPSRVQDLALYKAAWCCFRLDRSVEAARVFESVQRGFPDSVVAGESLFLAGESLYRGGHFDRSLRLLREFLESYPEHESRNRARFRAGLCLGEQGSWDDCLNQLTALERAAPDFEQRTEMNLWIGRALFHQGRLPEARQRLQKIIDNDRGILAARAHLDLGRCAMQDGQHEEALGEFLKVSFLYESEEEVSEGLWLAGQCLERMQDPERAAARYRELIQRHPENPHAAKARERLEQLRTLESQ